MVKGNYRKIVVSKNFNSLTKKRKILVILGIVFPTFINRVLNNHDFV